MFACTLAPSISICLYISRRLLLKDQCSQYSHHIYRTTTELHIILMVIHVRTNTTEQYKCHAIPATCARSAEYGQSICLSSCVLLIAETVSWLQTEPRRTAGRSCGPCMHLDKIARLTLIYIYMDFNYLYSIFVFINNSYSNLNS